MLRLLLLQLLQDPTLQDPNAAKNYVENPAPTPPVDHWGQLTKLASTFDHVDSLFYFTYAVCIFFFVLITGVLGYTVIVHRRKTFDQPPASTVTHHTPLEVVWTVVPLIIVMIIFAWGWKGSLDMTYIPQGAHQFTATARQWNWTFSYPHHPVSSIGEVWVEEDVPAAFTLISTDVLHAFSVPDMRAKRDVVPGRQQTAWFHPLKIDPAERLKPGWDEKQGTIHHLYCAEYCGQDHSKMYARVHVVSHDVFWSKGEHKEAPWAIWPEDDPAKGGENLYKGLCVSCHSLNGTVGTGPSWKGLFVKQGDQIVGKQGHEVVDKAGNRKTITVDDTYIIDSIRNPEVLRNADPRYANVLMTPFPDLDDKRVNGIIAFMKKLAAEEKQ